MLVDMKPFAINAKINLIKNIFLMFLCSTEKYFPNAQLAQKLNVNELKSNTFFILLFTEIM